MSSWSPLMSPIHVQKVSKSHLHRNLNKARREDIVTGYLDVNQFRILKKRKTKKRKKNPRT